MALGMAYNGSAGTTEEAMRSTLGFGDMTFEEINETFQNLIEMLVELDPEVQLQIANSIWSRQGFFVEPDFINVNQTYFDAEVQSLDFSQQSAVDIINAWVDTNTNGKIEEIVDVIEPFVVMILINAIYFNADWKYQFDPDLTSNDIFNKSDGTQSSCRMMKQENNFHYLETTEFQAVDLPYGNGQFSMTLFLPKNPNELNTLIETMGVTQWETLLGLFSTRTGTLHMPKFKLVYEIELTDVLTALGMGIAFDTAYANFTRINPAGNLFISKVLHKSYVEVDEEGTEAAAVTSVEISFTSINENFTMRLDRPFFFVIRENHSDTILFMGKINEPLTS